MPANVEELVSQFKEVVTAEREAVTELEQELSSRKSKLSSLEKAYQALNGDRVKLPKGTRRSPNGGVPIRARVYEALQNHPTAMDLGSLCRAVFGTDDSKHRTKISAALTNEVSDPQGQIRRISPGTYGLRNSSYVGE